MVGVLNDACLALMTSIGHRTGLFDAMAGNPPATSAEIAATSGLHERYVREWLGAMTVGGVIDYDASSGRYQLPAEHAASLTRSAGPENLAGMMQFVGPAGRRRGGGQRVLPRRRRRAVLGVPRVPPADGRGQRRRARRRARRRHRSARAWAPRPAADWHRCRRRRVRERTRPQSPRARRSRRAASSGTTSPRRRSRPGAVRRLPPGWRTSASRCATSPQLDETAAFDLITAFDAIHDQAKPAVVLANIADALRPDGTFLMVDIRASSNLEENVEHPLATFLYTASTMHCMTVSLALDGDGLGTVWGEQTGDRDAERGRLRRRGDRPRRGRHRQQLLHRPQGRATGVTLERLHRVRSIGPTASQPMSAPYTLSTVIVMSTRRSDTMAERYSSQSGCSPAASR